MTDPHDKRSDSEPPPPDLRRERDQFLQTFGLSGRLSEEFIADHERLAVRLREVEQENASLRAKVEADLAVRELLGMIERLEAEKQELLSRFHEVEATSSTFNERFQEVEGEFSNLANLFVASNQIHASMSPRGVMRRVKEVLAQLVGAERYAIYFINEAATELVPIASEGLTGDELLNRSAVDGLFAQVFRTGDSRVDEEADPSVGTVACPPAIIPLLVDESVVGLVAIYSTLGQKKRFDTVDYELFNLLGRHAATALVSSSLFVSAGRKLPGLEAFIDLSV